MSLECQHCHVLPRCSEDKTATTAAAATTASSSKKRRRLGIQDSVSPIVDKA